MNNRIAVNLIVFSILFFNFPNSFPQDKAENLTVLLNGVIWKTLEISEVKNISTTTVEFYDHKTRLSENFKGMPIISLLENVLPDQLKKIVEVELISKNGYKTYFPMESFYKVNAVLTYESVTNKFERYSQKEKKMVSLGPYYLVWDFKSLGKEDKSQFSSVYQINKINLVTNLVDFDVHEIKNNDTVTLGYRAFKKYCLSCHAIKTWGGNISNDLIKSRTIDRKGEDFLIKYLLNPQSIYPQTKMLPLPKYKNSQAIALGIVEFLKFADNPDLYLKKNKIESDKIRYDSFKSIINEMKKGH